MLPGPGLWRCQGAAHGWKCLDGGNAGTMEGRPVPHLTSQPKQPVFTLRHPTSGPLSSLAVSMQCCGCLEGGKKNQTVSFLGALRNQSLRFLNSQHSLEKISGVTAAVEDFCPSDGCPKAHTWFLRFLDKPGCLASSPFPVACSPAHLSSPLLSMRCAGCLHPVPRPSLSVSHLIKSSQLLSF